jgi:hypothetical protein
MEALILQEEMAQKHTREADMNILLCKFAVLLYSDTECMIYQIQSGHKPKRGNTFLYA